MIEYVSVTCRLLVGVILVLAGWAKLRGGTKLFLEAILSYDLVHRHAAQRLARSLPLAELALGVALVLGVLVPFAAGFAFLLVLVITGVVANALARGERHFCVCFGFTGDQVRYVQWSIVGRNIAMLGGLAFVALVSDPLRLV